MKQIISALLLAVLMIFFLFYFNDGSRSVIYDCRLAEISPDFPPEVKNQCRKMRSIPIETGRVNA